MNERARAAEWERGLGSPRLMQLRHSVMLFTPVIPQARERAEYSTPLTRRESFDIRAQNRKVLFIFAAMMGRLMMTLRRKAAFQRLHCAVLETFGENCRRSGGSRQDSAGNISDRQGKIVQYIERRARRIPNQAGCCEGNCRRGCWGDQQVILVEGDNGEH